MSERPPGFVFRKMKGAPHPSASSGQAFSQSLREAGKRGVARSVMYCEQIPLPSLAERFGTPLYVYSATAIRERYRAFDAAFRDLRHTICYSVKANSNISILRLLAKLGCGFDVVSGGELERVLAADRKAAKRVVFSGVGKTRAELTAALKSGILLFNVESESELEALSDCARKLRETAPVALRVNPDVAAETHPYISTGLHQHKFGIPIRDARSLYAKASSSKYLRVRGISVHIGSQITDAKPFGEAMSRVADLVRTLRSDGHQIEFIDAGGGLGISYQKANGTEFAESVGAYAEAIENPLRGLKVHLLLEPGRAILGPAGTLITSVIYRKENNGKKFLVVDAAMNDLIRPSLYNAYHEVVPVCLDGAPERETVDVVGPICETGDFLARGRELPMVGEGDLLAVLDAGAYGTVLSSNYNTRPRAAEVLVSGKSAKVVRRREKISDLLRQEL
jgi:diaminopimelate decarboxylase